MMPAPLLRKKPSEPKPFDPVSASTWAAGAKATADVIAVLELLKLNPVHAKTATVLLVQLDAATALTPCAVQGARIKPRWQWNFAEYLLAVRVCEALRSIIVDGVASVPVPSGLGLYDTTRDTAIQSTVLFVEQIEAYAKLVKRERAYERISGEKSLRRGLL